MRKIVVLPVVVLLAFSALFTLAPVNELFAQSLGYEVVGVVTPSCSNGEAVLVVRSHASTVSEFLQKSGELVTVPLLKLYHANSLEVVGSGISKESYLAAMTRPHECYKFGPPLDTNGATIIK